MALVLQAEVFEIGNHIKKSIRFIDEDGEISALVRKAQVLENKKHSTFEEFMDTRRKRFAKRLSRQTRRYLSVMEKIEAKVIMRVLSLAERNQVAFERLDRTFRKPYPNELAVFKRDILVAANKRGAHTEVYMWVFALGECDLHTQNHPPQTAVAF